MPAEFPRANLDAVMKRLDELGVTVTEEAPAGNTANGRRFDEDIEEGYTEEEQSIIDDAKKNGTYMRAPNGKRSNLTPKQWVRVRTEAFKKWFGDWKKAIRIDKLRKSKPLIIEKKDYDGKYPLDADSAQKWIKDNLRGEYTIDDTQETVLLSKVGAEEVTSHSRNDDAHLKSISSIPKMLKDAIFIEEQPRRKNNSKFDSYRYYVVGLKIDGVDYTAKIVIGVKNGKKDYDHRLTEIEKTELIDLVNQPAPDFTTAGNESLPPYIGGKDTKLNSILQINSSKIVDENGEPMVVYHSYDNDNYDSGLVFMSADKDFSEEFGSNIDAVFVNLRNPYIAKDDIMRDAEGNAIMFEGEPATIGYLDSLPSDYILWLQSNYDGVIGDSNTFVVAFEANQIKSADENVGTYSSENENIRYDEAATTSHQSEHKSRVAKHIDNLVKKLGTKAKTTVYHSLSEVPEEVRKHIEDAHKRGCKVRGWYENGEVMSAVGNIRFRVSNAWIGNIEAPIRLVVKGMSP